MAVIHGQIESLKKLKQVLISAGITEFNSIKEINDFLSNFRNEEEKVINTQKEILENEIKELSHTINENSLKYEDIRKHTLLEIEVYNEKTRLKIAELESKANRSFLHKIFYSIQLKKLQRLLYHYNTHISEIIDKATRQIQLSIEDAKTKLKYSSENAERIIKERSAKKINRLNYYKNTINNYHHLIAGAIGENLVVKEIEKLPANYILLNDYNLKFYRPIFNKATNDRIYSIQIDHLLVSKSGIYVLETKNWSKKSIESLDLRSPVEQISRTSYALFLLLNDANIRLSEHHWGTKQIPVKNIIVMINEKPKEEFKYVKVKTLKELNKYLEYFEPIFSDLEVEKIASYLLKIQNNNSFL